MFTQPIMYSVVRKHKDVMQLYSKQLQDEGKLTNLAKATFGIFLDNNLRPPPLNLASISIRGGTILAIFYYLWFLKGLSQKRK